MMQMRKKVFLNQADTGGIVFIFVRKKHNLISEGSFFFPPTISSREFDFSPLHYVGFGKFGMAASSVEI